ncbi:MAG: hypothetical protein A3C44_01765 [Gammaproteobacteria bacterium RIFCSPHIGHO2_02_FULL_39_13]|nr:MAG: hypothetical protein A3C44_01765 [Gammaproteobacteria bacterium RIFCSPHIGHO2_02_FULL_39_13]OGT49641.1 MAG: hypothetical protein A3E53_00510 [Gammaproteobacteria bacterium RIFCSPHIGHO2_12_FULL_39_24]
MTEIFMIILTNSAKAHIQNMLEKKGKNAVFRLSIKKTGCSGYQYQPEIVNEKNELDIEIRESDLPIYIDSTVADIIEGTVVDYVKKNLGISQLEFKNPHADSVCGCGESFQIKKV